MGQILTSFDALTLLGGAEFGQADLAACLDIAPSVIAADGGANAAHDHGLSPLAVIGDMDSIGAAARAAFRNVLREVDEQETTDFDKVLAHVAAPLILALGVSGGRFDHSLGAVHSLLARPERAVIIVDGQTVTCLCPPEMHLALEPGTLVSLFPMTAVRLASKGLRWPTDHLAFDPVTRIGTSNMAEGEVSLRANGPGMLLILPVSALGLLATGLLDAPRWPARGE